MAERKELKNNTDNNRNENNSLIAGLAIGAALGAGLTFLFGTDKGKRIRKKIRGEYPEFFERVDNVVENLGERYGDVVDEVKKLDGEVSEKSSGAKDVVKEKVANIGKAVAHLGKQLESVSKPHRFLRAGRKL